MNSNEQKEPTFTVDQIAEYLAGWTLVPFNEVEKLGANVAHNALSQLRDPQDGIAAYFNDRQHDKLELVLYLQGDDLYSCEIVNEHKKTIAVLHKGTLQEAIEGSMERVVRLLEHLLNLREKHC